MRKRLILIAVIMTCVVSSLADTAGDEKDKQQKRLEASLSYESLSPNDVYGSWRNVFLSYYISPHRKTTLFVQMGAFSRKTGSALLGVAGAYKDWADRFYTYTALAAGTNSAYLPQFRFDNDFNVKFGSKKNIVGTLGITYINYHDVHANLILSFGCTAYLERWISTYRIFRNRSDPGNITSYSHLVDVAYGQDGRQMTNVTLSFGRQAYLATYLARPEQVNQNSIYLVIRHRRWLRKGLGIIGDLSYFKLDEGYEKFGFTFGIFKEFSP